MQKSTRESLPDGTCTAYIVAGGNRESAKITDIAEIMGEYGDICDSMRVQNSCELIFCFEQAFLLRMNVFSDMVSCRITTG